MCTIVSQNIVDNNNKVPHKKSSTVYRQLRGYGVDGLRRSLQGYELSTAPVNSTSLHKITICGNRADPLKNSLCEDNALE